MLISGVTLPSRAQLLRDLVGDQLAVGEDLEVAVRVRGEQIEQLRVQERLAAENAEVGVAVRLGVVDDAVQLVERHASASAPRRRPSSPGSGAGSSEITEMNRNGGKCLAALAGAVCTARPSGRP